MSDFSILEVLKSNWTKPKHVLALNRIAIIEKIAWSLNWVIQKITKQIFAIKIIGNAKPVNAKNQKFSGDIYFEATEANRPIITR